MKIPIVSPPLIVRSVNPVITIVGLRSVSETQRMLQKSILSTSCVVVLYSVDSLLRPWTVRKG